MQSRGMRTVRGRPHPAKPRAGLPGAFCDTHAATDRRDAKYRQRKIGFRKGSMIRTSAPQTRTE
ncbi:MAG: hypothetical protein MI923_22845 [Phycisphaerales bacterium]|nr:hypothetical protein [Phycisphaerales bacterium]